MWAVCLFAFQNERGQVDVWSEKCIPPGTVHLRFPRLVPVAQRLKIDFAPAMVGFEIRRGKSVPVYEGIVVCEEFKEKLMEVSSTGCALFNLISKILGIELVNAYACYGGC
jgi:hypothetical protein